LPATERYDLPDAAARIEQHLGAVSGNLQIVTGSKSHQPSNDTDLSAVARTSIDILKNLNKQKTNRLLARKVASESVPRPQLMLPFKDKKHAGPPS